MMNWIDRGKIFDPRDHFLIHGCNEYAQSPQALVLDTFVRVYFSTRKRDANNGKFISHIAFVDFDFDFKNILRVSDKEVISTGALGCFDEHGIFPISPVLVNNEIWAYTCGWSRRKSVSVETSVGLVFSNDNGDTFKRKFEGPVLSSSIQEPFLVGDAFVRQYNSTFHMWYIFGTRWLDVPNEEAQRVYKIAYATSPNGIDWSHDGKPCIPDVLHADECQALPTVVEWNNKFHMFFCFRDAIGFRTDSTRAYRLGYASSNDLIHWRRDDRQGGIERPVKGWNSDMQCYPHIFECKNKLYLLYNGNEFGRYGFGLMELKSE